MSTMRSGTEQTVPFATELSDENLNALFGGGCGCGYICSFTGECGCANGFSVCWGCGRA
jgi:hypothetical protein